MINTTTLSTRKQKFISVYDELQKTNDIMIDQTGYNLISAATAENIIYLDYVSNNPEIFCTECGQLCSRNKGYRYVYPLMAKYNDMPIISRFKKKIMFCEDCNKCTVQSTTGVLKKNQISNSIKNCIINGLKPLNANYTSVANNNFVSVQTVINSVNRLTIPEQSLDVKIISVDEVRFIKSAGNYQFVIINAETGEIIDMLENREAVTVNKYYSTLNTEGITVIQDLWQTYKTAAKNHLNGARIVADMFHVVRQASWAFNRTRVAHIKKNGNKTKLRWRSLTMSISKFDSISKYKIKRKLKLDEIMQKVHQAKEMFFRACRTNQKEEFNRIYEAFKRYVEKHKLSEFNAVITSVTNWKEEIENAIETGLSNGLAERRNSDIKQIKRNARGFKNFERSKKIMMHKINNNTQSKIYYN